MRRHLIFGIPATFMAFVLLAGCASGTTPSEPGPATASTTPTLPSHGAPNVVEPLNTTGIDNSPCDAVTKEQIESLGVPLKKSSVNPNLVKSKYCHWILVDGAGTFDGGTVVDNPSGLSSLYATNTEGGLTHFQPTPLIEGYPGLVYAQGGRVGDGECTLAVGVRNDLTYTVNVGLNNTNPNYKDPCGAAQKIAGFAIQYLKGKQ
jgi:hypothetical protein